MVSCDGQPPSEEVNQTLLRPEMFVTNATCLPSGDQLVAPTTRVMYSFSMEKGCTSLLSTLLVICLGSVTGTVIGGAEVADSEKAEEQKISATKSNSLGICDEFTTMPNISALLSELRSVPFWHWEVSSTQLSPARDRPPTSPVAGAKRRGAC